VNIHRMGVVALGFHDGEGIVLRVYRWPALLPRDGLIDQQVL